MQITTNERTPISLGVCVSSCKKFTCKLAGQANFDGRVMGVRVQDFPAFGRPLRVLRSNIGIRPPKPFRAATEGTALLKKLGLKNASKTRD